MNNHLKTELINNSKKILIVGGNSLMQKIHPAFKEHGFDVDIANSGHEAMKLIKYHHGYDFILLDFDLPDLSGNEVAKLIRKYERKYLFPPCLIAICLAAMDSDQEKNCLDAGVNWIFQKPLSVETVVKIENYLDQIW